jgi:gentisate 1,2-dioxygenase
VYTVLEGRGYTDVNGQCLAWGRNDILGVPANVWRRHVNLETATNAVIKANRCALPSVSDSSLGALRRWGDGVRRGRREVEELLRERHDEVVDDRLHRHQSGRPPLRINDGDMPVGAATHLV